MAATNLRDHTITLDYALLQAQLELCERLLVLNLLAKNDNFLIEGIADLLAAILRTKPFPGIG